MMLYNTDIFKKMSLSVKALQMNINETLDNYEGFDKLRKHCY